MKFTKLETEILLHRLEFADGIAEALTDHCEGDRPASRFSAEQIEKRCNQLEASKLAVACIELNELDRDILEDCCDGSTFFGNMEDAVDFGEISRQKATAYYAAAASLSDKIGTQVATS